MSFPPSDSLKHNKRKKRNKHLPPAIATDGCECVMPNFDDDELDVVHKLIGALLVKFAPLELVNTRSLMAPLAITVTGWRIGGMALSSAPPGSRELPESPLRNVTLLGTILLVRWMVGTVIVPADLLRTGWRLDLWSAKWDGSSFPRWDDTGKRTNKWSQILHERVFITLKDYYYYYYLMGNAYLDRLLNTIFHWIQ